jgi:hypothetical protein
MGWFPNVRDMLVQEFEYGYSEAESFIYAIINAIAKGGG